MNQKVNVVKVLKKSKDKPIYKEPPLTDRRWSDAIKFAISKTVIENVHDYYYFNYDVNTKITEMETNLLTSLSIK